MKLPQFLSTYLAKRETRITRKVERQRSRDAYTARRVRELRDAQAKFGHPA